MSGSGSSGSDSGCVSSIPQESFCEDVGSPPYLPLGSQHSSAVEEKPRFTNSQYISAVSASGRNTLFPLPVPAAISLAQAAAGHGEAEDAAFGQGVTVGK